LQLPSTTLSLYNNTLNYKYNSIIQHGRKKTNDFDTATHATSTSGASYSTSRSAPVRNVNIETSMVETIEQQQQKIRQLQQQLAEVNQAKYKTTSSTEGRGKNFVCISKKVSMTATDQINQQTVASYLREAVWPSNKMLPKKWSHWREERNSMCQMILRKVALPVGVDKRSYWESLVSQMTNSVHYEQISNKKCLSSFKVSFVLNSNGHYSGKISEMLFSNILLFFIRR
jgi:hypothetical protein